MASGLKNAKDALESTWEALVPVPVDTGASVYAFIDTFVEERGGGLHRQLMWQPVSAFKTIEESPVTIAWSVPLELYMRRLDRKHDEFIEATEEEVEDLINAWSGIEVLGTDVREVMLESGSIDRERGPATPRSGNLFLPELLVVTFDFVIEAAAS